MSDWFLTVQPLSDAERGKGAGVSPEREAQIMAECLRLIREGCPQREIVRLMRSTRSSVSRWCQKAVAETGGKSDRASVKHHGRTLFQKLWDRIDASGPCWNWNGHVKENGYGSFNHDGQPVYPHRAMYENFIAPIPDGWVVDHVCNNRRCCNPDHLQAVTQSENLYFVGVDRVA